MEDNFDIKKLLDDMYYEFISQPAWYAHCYTFEYMEDYYQQLVSYLGENNIPTDELVSAYETAVAEFNRITESDHLSFLNEDDTKNLDDADYELLNKLHDTCEMLSIMLGIISDGDGDGEKI